MRSKNKTCSIMIGLVLLLLICVLWVFLRLGMKKNEKEPPIYPGAWPVIGHSLSLVRGRKKLWNFIRQLSFNVAHEGGVSSVLIGPSKIYVVCDPDDALLIANKHVDKSAQYKFVKTWVGESLLTSDKKTWKNDRKLLLPAFGHQVLVEFLESLNKEAMRVVEKLSTKVDQGDFDHVPYIKEYVVDTLCSSVLGMDFPEKTKYLHTVEFLLDIFIKRSLNVILHLDFVYNWTNLKKTQDKCIEFVNDIADKMINKKRLKFKEQLKNETGTKNNFLELILHLNQSAEGNEEETLSDKRIRDHLNFMITAGIDTILSVVPIILVTIGSHKAVQETIVKEIHEIFGDTDRDVAKDDLGQLVYLEAVIKESMRLFTPVPIVARKLEQEVKLKNCTLSAGKNCVLLLSGLNVHPIWGDDVLEFRPERWLPPSTPPEHLAAFAAFSIGRRNCIGKYYAMMSMKTLLVHILRNYVIFADWTKMQLTEDVITRVESGHHITLKRRF